MDTYPGEFMCKAQVAKQQCDTSGYKYCKANRQVTSHEGWQGRLECDATHPTEATILWYDTQLLGIYGLGASWNGEVYVQSQMELLSADGSLMPAKLHPGSIASVAPSVLIFDFGSSYNRVFPRKVSSLEILSTTQYEMKLQLNTSIVSTGFHEHASSGQIAFDSHPSSPWNDGSSSSSHSHSSDPYSSRERHLMSYGYDPSGSSSSADHAIYYRIQVVKLADKHAISYTTTSSTTPAGAAEYYDPSTGSMYPSSYTWTTTLAFHPYEEHSFNFTISRADMMRVA
jgi:hypothetical protein